MKSRFHHCGPARNRGGFTLVEMMVSIAILAVIMLLAAQMIGDTEKIWQTTNAKIDSFQGARAGFELMTDELRQATVNTYYDYFTANGQTLAQVNLANSTGSIVTGGVTTAFNPVSYGRQSELHFISGPTNGVINGPATASGASVGPNLSGLEGPPGVQVISQGVFFQYPQNYTDSVGSSTVVDQGYGVLQTLLNATGFFVEFGPEVYPGGAAWVANGPPSLITGLAGFQPSYRFRLMQFIQPSENLAVYNYNTTAGTAANAWFAPLITTPETHATDVRIVADNVIALIIWPKETNSPTDTNATITAPLSPNYLYDSRMGVAGGVAAWEPSATSLPGSQPLQMNQMAPILRVAMVTIDEPSAKALQGDSTTAPTQITNALTASNPNGSPPATLFTNSQNMDSDLDYLQTELAQIQPHINFRVFDTTIAVRSAKFSTVGQ